MAPAQKTGRASSARTKKRLTRVRSHDAPSEVGSAPLTLLNQCQEKGSIIVAESLVEACGDNEDRKMLQEVAIHLLQQLLEQGPTMQQAALQKDKASSTILNPNESNIGTMKSPYSKDFNVKSDENLFHILQRLLRHDGDEDSENDLYFWSAKALWGQERARRLRKKAAEWKKATDGCIIKRKIHTVFDGMGIEEWILLLPSKELY